MPNSELSKTELEESRREEFRESTVDGDRLCQEDLMKTEDRTCAAVTGTLDVTVRQ